MSSRTKTLATLVLIALSALAILAPAASAEPKAAWQVTLRSQQTNFRPGQLFNTQAPRYLMTAENVGAAATSGPITMTIQLPAGVSLAAGKAPRAGDQHHIIATNSGTGSSCSALGQTMTCTNANSIAPGEWVRMEVPVDVADVDVLPDPTVLEILGTVSGGGASPATTTGVDGNLPTTTISSLAPPFGFLPGYEGLNASAIEEDGVPATGAGSHPHGVNINFSISSTANAAGNTVLPNGTLDDVAVDLPAGMVVDPSATDKCTEAQLTAGGCPDATQVGIAAVPLANGAPAQTRLFNMVPPPGHAASFGFPLANVPVHILGGVRPGDYRITSLTPDAPSILVIIAARIQLWGSPSDESHDGTRGACGGSLSADADKLCPVTRTDKPLISMPTSCTDEMQIDAQISLWEELGRFYDRDTVLTDANGNTTAVTGCNALAGSFRPTLQARPTTNVADSPTGLAVELRIPQTDRVGEKATAHLRKAVVTLPEGLLLNPASANGLDGCDSGEIGIDPNTGVPDGDAVTCPDASRIGEVVVDTPLLDSPLPGSVYVATPFDNPFDSLLAIYVVVHDPRTNTLIKLPGHVVPNPRTGQLITTFDNNPQLPFNRFKLDFFPGAYAPLRTPATCGTYSTTSSMTPWSAPDSGPPANPKDSWSISQGPGGTCASNQSALPNSPSFDAGTVSPIAGRHSPFVLHLRRNDATQQFSSFSLKPPPGLVAKLAGTAICPDSALAAAASKTGQEEKANPSCPAASEVGSVSVAAGAGPSPYNTTGRAYLTGPYKGAPLSGAVIVPATAGPYDLGTVVVKTAFYVDSRTGEITAVTDKAPEILQGIVLDVRSIDVALDKPQFTLNPTNCDPMAVSGELLSTIDQLAPLNSRFQLGECGRLGFKPRLSLRLKGQTKRGGHPQLTAIMRPRPGDANIASVSVAFPKSEFLENAHIRTVCTRPDFAADNCPAGAVYGTATVTTALFDYPFAGNVYLRSSNNLLPDLVPDLRGPAHQPIKIESAGRTDSVNGGIRNTFDFVPDAPFTKLVLRMQGGNRGLLVNSRNICARTYRAVVKYTAHNGDTHTARPKVRAQCGRKAKRSRRRAHRRG